MQSHSLLSHFAGEWRGGRGSHVWTPHPSLPDPPCTASVLRGVQRHRVVGSGCCGGDEVEVERAVEKGVGGWNTMTRSRVRCVRSARTHSFHSAWNAAFMPIWKLPQRRRLNVRDYGEVPLIWHWWWRCIHGTPARCHSRGFLDPTPERLIFFTSVCLSLPRRWTFDL